jgi:predicted TIM-barrel fold metal-dependent hydrolase
MTLDSRFFKSSATGRPTEFGTIFAPVDGWLAQQPREEVVDPGLPIVDAHHHLWDHPFRYRLTDFSDDVRSGHNVVATVYVDCGTAYRTTGPEPERPVGETEHIAQTTASLAGGHPEIAAAIVGFADLGLGAAVKSVLASHVAVGAGRFRGVRFSTGWDESPEIANTQAAKRPNMLREPIIHRGGRVLASMGLTLDAWLFHTQLGDVGVLADAVPELRIAINHCGGPLGYGPYATQRESHFATWRRGLRELAKRPNVVCKLGGLLARGAAFDYVRASAPPTSDDLAGIWRPWFETCVEAFGPERCMFGSNFPVEKMGTGYLVLWNTFKKLASGASPGERHALFSATAQDFYRLSQHQTPRLIGHP